MIRFFKFNATQNHFDKNSISSTALGIDRKSLKTDIPKGDEYISGKGDFSTIPPEIRKWNWGAFMLTWIWGLGNNVYLSILCFIPVIGWIIPFVLASRGSVWAWRNKHWGSVEEFQRVQKRWAFYGVISGVIMLLLMIGFFLGMFHFFFDGTYYNLYNTKELILTTFQS